MREYVKFAIEMMEIEYKDYKEWDLYTLIKKRDIAEEMLFEGRANDEPKAVISARKKWIKEMNIRISNYDIFEDYLMLLKQ